VLALGAYVLFRLGGRGTLCGSIDRFLRIERGRGSSSSDAVWC
jgi:hypothetical protein